MASLDEDKKKLEEMRESAVILIGDYLEERKPVDKELKSLAQDVLDRTGLAKSTIVNNTTPQLNIPVESLISGLSLLANMFGSKPACSTNSLNALNLKQAIPIQEIKNEPKNGEPEGSPSASGHVGRLNRNLIDSFK